MSGYERALALALALFILQLACATAIGAPVQDAASAEVGGELGDEPAVSKAGDRKLKGRFLHITDIHPDPFYKIHSSTDGDHACHSGNGPAGVYGAETTECDSPVALLNATVDWLKHNLKHEVDFVIWTGDSARHDNDESIPRNADQVVTLNKLAVTKLLEVWGRPDNYDDDDPANDVMIPIIPTFGNNDILPHNIFLEGPNAWTRGYLDVWRQLIPEEQRHQFQRGGWFYVEAIPNRLAVISLNTMYFFTKNAAVDGCAPKSEPGYEHFEWLRIQLNLFRERGMKVMLIGHVPPARTENKYSWDESCWQKYTLWMREYRDIVVGSFYGHMNIEHFILQDFNDIKKSTKKGKMKATISSSDVDLGIESDSSYLMDLRGIFSNLASMAEVGGSTKKGDKKAGYLKKIGGKYAERYAVAHVSQSVIPNFFPTLRVYEYNVTEFEDETFPSPGSSNRQPQGSWEPQTIHQSDFDAYAFNVEQAKELKTNRLGFDAMRKKRKKHKKQKKHKFHRPTPPSKSTPPGPAYSPQTFSLLGYRQYFANLTYINNDFTDTGLSNDAIVRDSVDDQKWNPGKHHGRVPDKKPSPHKFQYEIEYESASDKIYKLRDITVRSYVELARKIGKNARSSVFDEYDTVSATDDGEQENEEYSEDDVSASKKGKKHKKKKHKKPNKVWYAFIKRAFAGALDPSDIEERFGESAPNGTDFNPVETSDTDRTVLGGSFEL